MAEIIVRIGLNLQRGQRLLVTDPYELQGVARGAATLVAAVESAATAAGARSIEVIWGDGGRLRQMVANKDWRGLVALLGRHAALMHDHVQSHDALLFLQSSQPALLAGVPPASAGELRRLAWERFGPVAQALTGGATNWTVAPAPTPDWAGAVYPELPVGSRLQALWEDVLAAMRVSGWSAASGRAPAHPSGLSAIASATAEDRVPPEADPLHAWVTRLSALSHRCDELNARQIRTVRFEGDGTDLTVKLAADHVWRTARLVTKSGLRFVANLPTEEIFTAPDKHSASGTIRVSRPVSHAGTVIEGTKLTFKRGRITEASAASGAGALEQLLATDDGACHLGEVALVPAVAGLAEAGPDDVLNPPGSPTPPPTVPARHFFHPLLDENAANHVALGDAYAFTARRPDASWLNRSLIHLDLPLDARPAFSN